MHLILRRNFALILLRLLWCNLNHVCCMRDYNCIWKLIIQVRLHQMKKSDAFSSFKVLKVTLWWLRIHPSTWLSNQKRLTFDISLYLTNFWTGHSPFTKVEIMKTWQEIKKQLTNKTKEKITEITSPGLIFICLKK